MGIYKQQVYISENYLKNWVVLFFLSFGEIKRLVDIIWNDKQNFRSVINISSKNLFKTITLYNKEPSICV